VHDDDIGAPDGRELVLVGGVEPVDAAERGAQPVRPRPSAAARRRRPDRSLGKHGVGPAAHVVEPLCAARGRRRSEALDDQRGHRSVNRTSGARVNRV
jgi:hypothetical protein